MKDRDDRLEAKIDKVVDEITAIQITLAKQHVSLDDHIRRTSILENELKPIKKHVTMVDGVFKFLGFLALIGAGVEGIAFLVGHL